MSEYDAEDVACGACKWQRAEEREEAGRPIVDHVLILTNHPVGRTDDRKIERPNRRLNAVGGSYLTASGHLSPRRIVMETVSRGRGSSTQVSST